VRYTVLVRGGDLRVCRDYLPLSSSLLFWPAGSLSFFIDE
jgi:hypothetical protein